MTIAPGKVVGGIVGREDELGAVRAFVDRAQTDASALVLEGEAGIGKSTLWRAGVDHAAASGLRVLSSRPVEAEHALALAGLGDVLEGTFDAVIGGLSAPRRRTLEAALLLGEAETDAVDTRALGIATRSALQLLADSGPVLVAIDDLQWLDPASDRALAFAVRRLSADEVLLLLARRLEARPHLSELERAAAGRLEPLRLGPLSVGAMHALLRDRLGRTFARQTLLRIHERSAGNPFFALELARAMDVGADLARPAPIPETLDELVRARITDLPELTREALALAAALGTPSESLLERAGVTPAVLEPALVARVIERDQGTIRFTHPLLSAALYADLGEQVRSMHRRIAGIVDDPIVRARHLALSREDPDSEVADVVEQAARLAADRGASSVAAELADRALYLTPPAVPADRRRRALAAARAHHVAGEWTRARTIATELVAETENGPLRAEALVLLAELESVDRAVVLLEEALRDADGRPELQSAILCRLAWATRFRKGYVLALEHARAALELAEALDEPVLRERAAAVQAILGWIVGDAEATPLPAQAHDFATAVGGEQLVQEATLALVNTLAPRGRRDEARALLEREHREWQDRDEPRSARALWGLAWVEFWAGKWTLAAEHAAVAYDVSIQYGLEVPQDHLPIALVAVHRGRFDLARDHSERALRLADEQFALRPPQHMAILGLAALWDGDRAEALDWLDRAEERAAMLGWGEPSIRWWSADHVELLLELGRIDDAVRVLDAWEADAQRVGRAWVLAQVTRCRGLVAAAEGDVGRADSLLQRAVEHHEEVGDPFGHARAVLALGVVRRRGRQKRPAREAIEESVAAFDALGAEAWASRARAELGRVGGRTREDGLTAAERRVASLVAEGRTNREVAAALFLSQRTVASHLTHVYAKLGVRSRTELARRLEG